MESMRDVLPLIGLGVGSVALLVLLNLFELRRARRREERAREQARIEAEAMGELPDPTAYARSFLERNRRPACFLLPGPALQPEDVRATYIGAVRVLGEGEQWPQCDGVAMVGLAQFNLLEAPYVPEDLQGLALVSVFMVLGSPFRVEVRGYKSLEELVGATGAPPVPEGWRPCGAQARLGDDFPSFAPGPPYEGLAVQEVPAAWEVALLDAVQAVADELPDDLRWGPKLGGWPAPVQDPLERPLGLQIGYENGARINLVDTGCVYAWRSMKDGQEVWETDFQFY